MSRYPGYTTDILECELRLPPCPGAPDGFRGTVDALLEWLRDGSLDLRTVPLRQVIEQYVAFLHTLPHDTMDAASEFVQLAATLIHLKSQLLTPALPSEDPEAPSPSATLVQEEIIRQIARQERRRRDAAADATALPWEDTEGAPERLRLLDLMVLLQEVQSSVRTAWSVAADEWTVEQAMAWLRAALPAEAATTADRYFEQQPTAQGELSVFLALLELVRTGVLNCYQAEAFAPLWLWAVEPDAFGHAHT